LELISNRLNPLQNYDIVLSKLWDNCLPDDWNTG